MAAKRKGRTRARARAPKVNELKAVKVNAALQAKYKKRLQTSNVQYKKQVDRAANTILNSIANLDRNVPGAFQKQAENIGKRIKGLERNLRAANKRSTAAVDVFMDNMLVEHKRRLKNSLKGKVSEDVIELQLKKRSKSLTNKIDKLRKQYKQSITEANQDYSTRVQAALYEKLANPGVNARKRIQKSKGIVTRRIKNTVQNQAHETNATLNKTTQTAIGIRQYRWKNKGDNRVRETHKHKNVEGQIFNWSEPPVETGGLHPGEDHGCRCIAIPILPDEIAA